MLSVLCMTCPSCFQCRYVPEYLAVGEAPDQVRNCFQQRSRWCKVRCPRNSAKLLAPCALHVACAAADFVCSCTCLLSTAKSEGDVMLISLLYEPSTLCLCCRATSRWCSPGSTAHCSSGASASSCGCAHFVTSIVHHNIPAAATVGGLMKPGCRHHAAPVLPSTHLHAHATAAFTLSPVCSNVAILCADPVLLGCVVLPGGIHCDANFHPGALGPHRCDKTMSPALFTAAELPAGSSQSLRLPRVYQCGMRI